MGHSISGWIDRLVGDRSPSPALGKVIDVLRSDPELCAFATTQELARIAGVNVATVTRTAQFLGFSGWPAFTIDYRGQYLATLTAGQMLGASGGEGAGVRGLASVLEDVRVLGLLAETLEETVISRAAELITRARQGVVLATGVYAAPATQLAHSAQLLGFDLSLQAGAVSNQMTAVRRLGSEDVLVTFNIWKTTEAVNQLALHAAERGVPLIAFVDRSTPVAEAAEVVITVPSESLRFLPSTVPVVSAVQALLAEMAEQDRASAQRSLREADEWWKRFGVVVDPS